MGRSVAVALAVLAGASVLAGCAQPAASDAAPMGQAEPSVFQQVTVTKTTGVVRGFVVDEAIRPLAGVRITLTGEPSFHVTSSDGAFAFGDLAPGDYPLAASKPGYLMASTTAHVEAGAADPPLVRLQLAIDPVQQPYVELQKWSGFMECGVGSDGGGEAGRSLLPCAAAQSTGAVRSDTLHDFDFGTNATPTFAQAELVWSTTESFGNDLKMDFPSLGVNVGGNGSWAAQAGASPVIIAVGHDSILAALGDAPTHIGVRILPGESQPVTVTLEQAFDVYMSYFYRFQPRAGWTFAADGQCSSPSECG